MDSKQKEKRRQSKMDKLDMEYTDENVMAVAQEIVDDMDLDDLMTYVYDDLCAIMDKDEELFHINVEHFQSN